MRAWRASRVLASRFVLGAAIYGLTTVGPAIGAEGSPATAATGPGYTSGTDVGFFSAGALADRCSGAGGAGLPYCFAYITAVHDAMRAYEIWLGEREFCPPAGVAQADLRRTFLTYLTAYPDRRSGQAASVIVVAFKETYPCLAPAQPSAPAHPATGK